MKIDSVDAFYFSMPEIYDIGDGSQDALLIRVRGGGTTGWGECEAAPLPSIAALVCPMSHSACKPVAVSVVGESVECPGDIDRVARRVRAESLDLLQADHVLSGVEIALWDLLGKVHGEPVFSLLGHKTNAPKLPYASALFAASPQQTLDKARAIRAAGYRAAKFGWGPFGRAGADADNDQVHAAREGLGADAELLVDAGTVWDEDVEAAAARLPSLEQANVLWLEEPFTQGALRAYRTLAGRTSVRLAAGEGAHNAQQAENLIDHGGIGYVQIDTGRIGGIGAATRVAEYARAREVRFVNHTFTTHLALSASLQPFAGSTNDVLCEYPVEASELATRLTRERIEPDADGFVHTPERPGLGISLDLDAVRPYLVPVDLSVGGRTLYRTPELTE